MHCLKREILLNQTRMIDRVSYKLPFGFLGESDRVIGLLIP